MRIAIVIALIFTRVFSYAQDILTIGEVFDFSTGDEFHYTIEGNQTYPNAEVFSSVFSMPELCSWARKCP
jgi:hypothetical protein